MGVGVVLASGPLTAGLPMGAAESIPGGGVTRGFSLMETLSARGAVGTALPLMIKGACAPDDSIGVFLLAWLLARLPALLLAIIGESEGKCISK